MPMTTTFTLTYEGPPSCVDCQRDGIPVCTHIGFNPESWDGIVGRLVYAPGLDAAYDHTLTRYEISDDRKTLTLTVDTERPPMRDLARHLSTRGEPRAKAAVRAVHDETGATLEEGHYDAWLQTGTAVCIDRDLYHVVAVSHPNRDPDTQITIGDTDWQEARLMPVPTEQVRPVEVPHV